MTEAYNFIAAWQLFPEKGTYDRGQRPKSGQYRIEALDGRKALRITQHWVTLEDQACESTFTFEADGEVHQFEQPELGDRCARGLQDPRNSRLSFSRKVT